MQRSRNSIKRGPGHVMKCRNGAEAASSHHRAGITAQAMLISRWAISCRGMDAPPREGRQASWEMSTKNRLTLGRSPEGDMTWESVWFGALRSNHGRSMLMLTRLSSQRLEKPCGSELWVPRAGAAGVLVLAAHFCSGQYLCLLGWRKNLS